MRIHGPEVLTGWARMELFLEGREGKGGKERDGQSLYESFAPIDTGCSFPIQQLRQLSTGLRCCFYLTV